MTTPIEELVEISRLVGSDESLVQGGGGNTSVKSPDGRIMYIKASGTSLALMTTETGYLALGVAGVRATITDMGLAEMEPTAREAEVLRRLMAARTGTFEADVRPSVESSLHALLARYVVHTHPVAVGAVVCSKEGEELVDELIRRTGYSIMWSSHSDPGYPLAVNVARQVDDYVSRCGHQPDVLLLENHGVFASSDDFKRIRMMTGKLVSVIEEMLRERAPGFAWDMPCLSRRPDALESEERLDMAARVGPSVRTYLKGAFGFTPVITCADSPVLTELVEAEDGREIVKAGALTPDQVVYCKASALWVPFAEMAGSNDERRAALVAAMEEYNADHGFYPQVVVVERLGVFSVAPKLKEALLRLVLYDCAVRIVKGAAVFGGAKFLTERQAGYVEKWEAESYRRKVAAGTGENRMLEGSVAVVTGGGSGLGKGIAVGLARAGAAVALADIDLDAARQTQEEMNADTQAATSTAVACDVTDEASVVKVFRSVMLRYGGVDILVNAAGIAPSYALVNFPVSAWCKSLDVNLTGYFLMAREAARWMILQAGGGNIVNLSSKTGLDASKNNSAYNATKSGEVHLARGWAMELGAHGIRVNAVAPGNVFEGSKIWNPEYIKACAAKRGLKPEEVIPYYIGMTHLKREIKPQDVANTVVFLCSDMARVITGQTIVPDSGQVFVR